MIHPAGLRYKSGHLPAGPGSSHLHSVNETKKLGALDAIAKPGKFSELKKFLHSILE